MLGLSWIAAAAMALRAVRNRRFDQHRDWMIRSYAVAWGAVLFRFWQMVLPAAWQAPPSDQLWTSWILPLLLAEVGLQWRAGRKAVLRPAAERGATTGERSEALAA